MSAGTIAARRALMQLPDGDSGGIAGPTFDYVPVAERSTITSRNGSIPASGGGR
jgi:hypothetical protein